MTIAVEPLCNWILMMMITMLLIFFSRALARVLPMCGDLSAFSEARLRDLRKSILGRILCFPRSPQGFTKGKSAKQRGNWSVLKLQDDAAPTAFLATIKQRTWVQRWSIVHHARTAADLRFDAGRDRDPSAFPPRGHGDLVAAARSDLFPGQDDPQRTVLERAASTSQGSVFLWHLAGPLSRHQLDADFAAAAQ